MSASRKITAVQFVEWMHKHRYAKYWGSDKPNCEKWYIMNTMPDRKYYTLEELYDIFEREQKETKQQGNCNKPAVSKCEGIAREAAVCDSICGGNRLGAWCAGCEDKYRCNLYKAN
jgi:hypothetical protein